MANSFLVVPAAYVFLRRDDEVLLQLRQNTGYMDDHWAASAAGHVEADESVFAAAQRESEEELGIHLDFHDLLPICTMHRTQQDGRQISECVDFFFSTRRWSGLPRIAESEKVADLRWFGLTDLPPNLVPHERVILERIDDATLPRIVSHGFGS